MDDEHIITTIFKKYSFKCLISSCNSINQHINPFEGTVDELSKHVH